MIGKLFINGGKCINSLGKFVSHSFTDFTKHLYEKLILTVSHECFSISHDNFSFQIFCQNSPRKLVFFAYTLGGLLNLQDIGV